MPEGQKVYSQGYKPLDKKTSTRNNPKGVEEKEFSFRPFRANHFIIHLLLILRNQEVILLLDLYLKIDIT